MCMCLTWGLTFCDAQQMASRCSGLAGACHCLGTFWIDLACASCFLLGPGQGGLLAVNENSHGAWLRAGPFSLFYALSPISRCPLPPLSHLLLSGASLPKLFQAYTPHPTLPSMVLAAAPAEFAPNPS